jgi:hypothetical protein
MTSKPAALVPERPSLTSESYQDLAMKELVEKKFCFVGAPKMSQGEGAEVKTH